MSQSSLCKQGPLSQHGRMRTKTSLHIRGSTNERGPLRRTLCERSRGGSLPANKEPVRKRTPLRTRASLRTRACALCEQRSLRTRGWRVPRAEHEPHVDWSRMCSLPPTSLCKQDLSANERRAVRTRGPANKDDSTESLCEPPSQSFVLLASTTVSSR
jgi:hypothetical protein